MFNHWTWCQCLYVHYPPKKSSLTAHHKKACIELDCWKVILSDFQLWVQVYVRWMAGEEFKEECIKPAVKYGGGGIMVCGCINTRCWLSLESRWKAEWGSTHQSAGVCTYRMLRLLCGWIFQQNNTSRQGWVLFKEEGIPLMDWLAQSPNLNLIENMGDQSKAVVQNQNPSTVISKNFGCL